MARELPNSYTTGKAEWISTVVFWLLIFTIKKRTATKNVKFQGFSKKKKRKTYWESINPYKLNQLANHIFEKVHKAFENSLNTLHIVIIILSITLLQFQIVQHGPHVKYSFSSAGHI